MSGVVDRQGGLSTQNKTGSMLYRNGSHCHRPDMEASMYDGFPDKPTVGCGSPETAFAAADNVADAAKTRETKLLALLRCTPTGCTSDEVADYYGRERYSLRPRLCLIDDAGERRKGAFGRSQVVWTATGVRETRGNG